MKVHPMASCIFADLQVSMSVVLRVHEGNYQVDELFLNSLEMYPSDQVPSETIVHLDLFIFRCCIPFSFETIRGLTTYP